MSGDRRRHLLRSLRVRVPATAMVVFAVSLAVAAVLAFELALQDGRRDIDVVIAREQERFALSVSELLAEALEEDPEVERSAALAAAVRRYLQLNPSTDSYWSIVTLADGRRFAAANGPPELEPLFREDRLPSGRRNVRETIATEAGDVRTSTVPVRLDGEEVATFQVVSPLAPVRAEAFEAAGLLAAAAGFSLLLGGVLLAASLWRSLTPLVALAGAARSTELRALDARVEVPDTADEVGLLAREFNTMLDRLEAASAQQRGFMASVGHELRTPLTIARGHLETLRSTDDPEELSETVAIVQDELQRMGRLVEDLMAIARSSMEDFVRPRSLELVQWFEDLELKLAGTEVGRRVQIEPPPPVELQADPDRLAQAVLNLVTNADVHTPAGTGISVRARIEGGRVVVAVEDDGDGIPDAIRNEVFAPFVRGEAPSSTGLGLSVVQAVVDAHGGEVRLETGGWGTRVELHLPWSPAEADDQDLSPTPDDVAVAPPAPAGTSRSAEHTDTVELPALAGDPERTRPTLRVTRSPGGR